MLINRNDLNRFSEFYDSSSKGSQIWGYSRWEDPGGGSLD